MSRIWSIVVLVIAIFSVSVVSSAAPDTEAELKARFGQRHSALARLQDAGKLGETAEGLVEVVREKFEGESVKMPDGETMAMNDFVQAENKDRKALYRIIGERTGESDSSVAKQAAIRNFKKARPNHFLKLGNGKWVQKKDLPAPK